MSRTEVAVVALIVLLMAWLLMPPPVVVKCNECLSAWPVWPAGEVRR